MRDVWCARLYNLLARARGKVTSKYEVEFISIEDRDKLVERYGSRFLYEERTDIYGCCIKLLTDIKYVKERWEESFYPMSAHVRSHGRLIVTQKTGISRLYIEE